MTLFNKRIFYTVLILFLILNFSINLFSQTEIGLLPINIDLNERVYVDAFRKLKTNVKKTHQPPYQGDIEMHLENYLKRYLNFKGIKLVDFPMDKLSKEEIKENNWSIAGDFLPETQGNNKERKGRFLLNKIIL